MIWGSGGSKSRLAKAAGAEPAGQMRDEKVHAVVARSTFPSEKVQNTWVSEHFWKLRCRKSARRCGAKHISKWKCTKHTMVGPLLEVEMSKKCTPLWREAHFQVKMYKHTPASDHFWKLRCRKSARRCGAKHISKSKCTKHTMHGPFLEVQMSKKCTPLCCEAHFQVKMYKTHHVRTIFGGSDVLSRARARDCGPCQKWAKGEGFVAFSTTTTTTLHSNTLHYTTTTTTPSLHSTTLHSTTLHCTQLHSITLHYTTLHYLPLHYITLRYTPLHYTSQHYTTTTTAQLHSTTLHYYTTLNYTTLNYTTLHYITLHYTPLHCTTLHYTTLPSTTLHYITLHYTQLHYNYTPLHSTTLDYTKLHYTTRHYTTLHYIPLHFTTLHNTTLHRMTLRHR